MKKPLLLILLTCLCLFSYGQTDVRSRGSGAGADQPAQPQQGQKRYSGRILDQNGQPVVGATISVVDAAGKTVAGTYTDADGNYSVSAAPGLKLKVSSVSYTTTETTLGDSETLNYTLQEESKLLSDVVVIGYGEQNRREVTGSSSTIQGNATQNFITGSFDQQLGGRAAGLQVATTNGLLGTPARIRIRGTNTISGDGSPLIVVDGLPILSGVQTTSGFTFVNPLTDINPADIESYEILKDGASTAIYGSRAANGVILITTKRGKMGAPKVTYEYKFGVATVAKTLSVLSAADFNVISNEKQTNILAAPVAFGINDANGNLINSEWQKEIFRNGVQQEQNISISGATDKVNYYFGIGYSQLASHIVTNDQQRITGRYNLDYKVKDWLTIGTQTTIARTIQDGLNTGGNALGGNVVAALQLLPNVPIYLANGNYNISGASVGQGNNTIAQQSGNYHITYTLQRNIQRNTAYRFASNVYAQFKIWKGLSFRTQYGIDFSTTEDYTFLNSIHGDGLGVNGLVSKQSIPTTRWNWQNYFTFDHTFFEKHKVTLVLGSEYQSTIFSSFSAQGTAISDPFFNNLISGTFTTPAVTGGFATYGFESLFSRFNYSYSGKYLFGAAIRRDGISQFSPANKYGNFWGLSAGWRISEEEFFKNVSFLSVVSDLKIRGSVGLSGNTGIPGGAYPYLSQYGPAQYASQNGIALTQQGNADLRWETSRKFDLGLDVGLFKDRIRLNFDYFLNTNNGLVLNRQTAGSLGIPLNQIPTNVGSSLSTGFEVTISSLNLNIGGFTWNTDFNISTLSQKVVTLATESDLFFTYNIARVGEQIGAFFGYQSAGVNPLNGNPLYEKADGSLVQGNIADQLYYLVNADGSLGAPSTLSINDRRVLGPSNPTLYGGITNTFKYKGFDLEIFMRFAAGHYIYNVTRQTLFSQLFLNNTTDILGRWTTPGQQTDVPRLAANREAFINGGNQTISRFLERGDFLRIQNITLGYTLPADLVSKASLNRVRVYVQVQNPVVWTKYKGYDPEVQSGINNNNSNGIDQAANPLARTWVFGIQVGF